MVVIATVATVAIWQASCDRNDTGGMAGSTAASGAAGTTDSLRIDAIGDSITFGIDLGFTIDETGRPAKSMSRYQGWPELLAELLTETTGEAHVIANHGVPGDRTLNTRRDRLPAIDSDGTSGSVALVLTGTNDSNDFKPTASGLGCKGLACKGTFKGELEQLVLALEKAGRSTVRIATITPAWGSSLDEPYPDPFSMDATRTERVREYNRVILERVSTLPGVVAPGPDLFACFLNLSANRFSLFEDSLHPNALGYVFMAALWREAITKGTYTPPLTDCPSPIYILESLDSYAHGHKQNVLAPGDEYYTDEAHTLTSIPTELENGIWVLQANADRHNADPDFLTFDAGAEPVTVYIAYDAAGNPPVSTSHEFEAVSLSGPLTVSDPAVNSFDILRAAGVTGRIAVGGTGSAPSPGPQQAYTVIVVP